MKEGKFINLLYLAGTAALLLALGVLITDSPKSPVPVEYVYWEEESSRDTLPAPPLSSEPAQPEPAVSSRPEPEGSAQANPEAPPASTQSHPPPEESSEPVKIYLGSNASSGGETSDPRQDAPPPEDPEPEGGEGEAPSSPSGPVNLNTAGLAELQTLDGIGPVLAQRILDFRAQSGGFHSVEDLLYVSGIGEKKLTAIRDRVTV